MQRNQALHCINDRYYGTILSIRRNWQLKDMKHSVSATKMKNKVVVIEISCAIEQNACGAYIWKAALLSVGLTVVLEVEDDASLSLSDGLTVVLEVDDVPLPALELVAELLAVVLEVLWPFAELDELLGGRIPGLLGPLPALGHSVITASSLGPAEKSPPCPPWSSVGKAYIVGPQIKCTNAAYGLNSHFMFVCVGSYGDGLE
jgi:hypothetical protein